MHFTEKCTINPCIVVGFKYIINSPKDKNRANGFYILPGERAASPWQRCRFSPAALLLCKKPGFWCAAGRFAGNKKDAVRGHLFWLGVFGIAWWKGVRAQESRRWLTKVLSFAINIIPNWIGCARANICIIEQTEDANNTQNALIVLMFGTQYVIMYNINLA